MTLEEAIQEWQTGNYENCFPVIYSAAENDNSEAQLILGCVLMTDSWGLEENLDEAISWLKKATSFNNFKAASMLSTIYDPENPIYNEKINKDITAFKKYSTIAFKGFMEGAQQGDAEAMYGLSTCYSIGTGTEIDMTKATYWANKSKELGFDAIQ